MGHKGHYGNYSGNHPRFSKRQDEAYDAKMAYNKDLTGKARLHYLENDIADKKSPANSNCSPMHQRDFLTKDALKGYEGSLERLKKQANPYTITSPGLDYGDYRETYVDERTGLMPVLTDWEAKEKPYYYPKQLQREARINPFTGRSLAEVGGRYSPEGILEYHSQKEGERKAKEKYLAKEFDRLADVASEIKSSPMGMHTDAHIRRQAEKIAKKREGDVQDIYYELKSRAADERSGKKKGNDERSGEQRRKDIDEMIYERPDINRYSSK